MGRPMSFARTTLRLVRYGCLAGLLLAFLGLAGCRNLLLDQQTTLPSDPAFEWARRARPADRNNEFWGVSNKARQIERDVGIAN